MDCCLTSSEIQKLLAQSGVNHLRDVPLEEGEHCRPWSLLQLPSQGSASPLVPLTSSSIADLLLQGAAGFPSGTHSGASDSHPIRGDMRPNACDDDMEVDDDREVSPSELSSAPTSSTVDGSGGGLFSSPGAGGSGGYMDFVFRQVVVIML